MKYLWAYSIPTTTFIAIYFQGKASYFTVLFAFVIIPIFEILLPVDSRNATEEEEKQLAVSKIYDLLLYLNVPIVFGLLYYFLITASISNISAFEIIGLTLCIGILLGANGINVAHELGHRVSMFERILAKILLIPSLYMHFFIEHNLGHHVHVATAEDPSTAKYNQSLYRFWKQTVIGTYRKAWQIQRELNRRNQVKWYSTKNEMLWFTLIQFAYLAGIYYFFNLITVGIAISAAVVGFLLLETINYIEHYGLLRNRLPSGRYVRVDKIHSWNSNFILGRIILYELTRHSDHHYKSSKKYQTLKNHPESPELPYGYPTSMVLALIPPIWFQVMNKNIPKEMLPENKKTALIKGGFS
ncbi:MAG: alkane 1-monooxygenase [Bacteroidetes bacterium HGW-Bacteroidetes-2]|jgi:alkane 1-monooxygenase|nr:MAG: alkane 1-monooxygenase [Bacteroidetes bacterium HGW-Bacteroidetes-2]